MFNIIKALWTLPVTLTRLEARIADLDSQLEALTEAHRSLERDYDRTDSDLAELERRIDSDFVTEREMQDHVSDELRDELENYTNDSDFTDLKNMVHDLEDRLDDLEKE